MPAQFALRVTENILRENSKLKFSVQENLKYVSDTFLWLKGCLKEIAYRDKTAFAHFLFQVLMCRSCKCIHAIKNICIIYLSI